MSFVAARAMLGLCPICAGPWPCPVADGMLFMKWTIRPGWVEYKPTPSIDPPADLINPPPGGVDIPPTPTYEGQG